MPIVNLGDTLTAFVDYLRGLFSSVEDEVTGSISNTVQAIVEIKEMDCGGDWTVYVKTAFPAALEALKLLIVPSFGEILENYLEPKAGRRGGRRGRHGERERRVNRAGQRRLYFGAIIPDVDELIADRLPGRGIFSGRRAGPTEWVFWTSVNVADRALWHWLLLEATETFATNWQSGILESGQCIRSGPAYCKVQTNPQPGGNTDAFWGPTTALPVKIFSNMDIQVNGIVDLEDPDTLSSGYVITETEWTFENTADEGTTIYQVGFRVWGTDKDAASHLIKERGETVHVPPGATITRTITDYSTYALFRAWRGEYRRAIIDGAGSTTVSVVGKLHVMAEALGSE